MSFERLSSLEAQPASGRAQDEQPYHDDPDFQRLTQSLSNQLFALTSNISHLSNQIALLGTKRDTERVRERVHNLLEETREGFRDVGDGLKKVQMWEDVNVRVLNSGFSFAQMSLTWFFLLALPKMDAAETICRVQVHAGGVSVCPAASTRKTACLRCRSSSRRRGIRKSRNYARRPAPASITRAATAPSTTGRSRFPRIPDY